MAQNVCDRAKASKRDALAARIHLGDFDSSFAGHVSGCISRPASCISCKSVCSCDIFTVSRTDQQSLSAFEPANAWKLEYVLQPV